MDEKSPGQQTIEIPTKSETARKAEERRGKTLRVLYFLTGLLIVLLIAFVGARFFGLV